MIIYGGAVASWLVASWLVPSSPDRAVRVRVLAGDIVSCSWARHFTLTVPLSTQVYTWVPTDQFIVKVIPQYCIAHPYCSRFSRH